MGGILSWHLFSIMDKNILSNREVKILEAIVRNYILTALPTGSRFIAKKKGFDLSSATIRNIMGDLEEKGLITQPHKSAGRIPTDKGYRFYVDLVAKSGILPKKVQVQIQNTLYKAESSDLHLVMEATSKALSRATGQLGIILSPKLCDGIFRHIHIYSINQNKFLMNLTIDSGFVKTVVVELTSEINSNRIEAACKIINERYNGLSLQKIFLADDSIFSDVESVNQGVIRLFIPSIQQMLEKQTSGEIITDGKANILLKPEFFNKEQVGSIIEVLEEKNLLMHIFGEEKESSNRVIVSIGGEIENGQFSSFSIVKTNYKIGNMEGYLGVIGPKRMPYPYLISAVEYTSKILENTYKQ